MSTHATPFGRDAETSERILAAVAAREGVDPMDLTVPLYDAIDVDALDKLTASQTVTDITFTYYGYEISVDSDGAVEISD
jgi:hypothetical protein